MPPSELLPALTYHVVPGAKREVHFLVVRDRTPWFLVEVKRRDLARVGEGDVP